MTRTSESAVIVASTGLRVCVAILIDFMIFSVVFLVACWLLTGPWAELGIALLLVFALYAWVVMKSFVTRGTTPGWALTGIRLVTAQDLSPVSWTRFGKAGKLVAANCRQGRDPILAATPPPTLGFTVQPGRPSAQHNDQHRVDSVPPQVHLEQSGTYDPSASEPTGGVPNKRHRRSTPQTSSITPAGSSQQASPSTPVVAEADIERSMFVQRSGVQWQVYVDGVMQGLLHEPVIIGRNPSSETNELSVTIPDINRQLSKNHIRLAVYDGTTIVATDLCSTNGSTLRSASGKEIVLHAHAPIRFGAGTAVLIGDHQVTFKRVMLEEQ